jgi:hypothetical protein
MKGLTLFKDLTFHLDRRGGNMRPIILNHIRCVHHYILVSCSTCPEEFPMSLESLNQLSVLITTTGSVSSSTVVRTHPPCRSP